MCISACSCVKLCMRALVFKCARMRLCMCAYVCTLPIDNILLLYDNARPHTSIRTKETIASFGRTTYCILHTHQIQCLQTISSLRSYERRFKRQTLYRDEEGKTAVMKWFKEQSTEFYKVGYMLSFEDGKLLLWETLTMLRSRDVIHRGQASFWCMIHVLVSVIIPALKKGITF